MKAKELRNLLMLAIASGLLLLAAMSRPTAGVRFVIGPSYYTK
jgi:hypothetical protein